MSFVNDFLYILYCVNVFYATSSEYKLSIFKCDEQPYLQ